MFELEQSLRSGLIPAGAYSNKLRRTLFAQLSKQLKAGVVTQQEIARAVAELNTFLYHVLVEELKLEKTEPVRIEINYRLQEGRIVWDYKSLRIMAYKALPQNLIELAIQYALSKQQQKTEASETPIAQQDGESTGSEYIEPKT